jgi:hypothetical protein
MPDREREGLPQAQWEEPGAEEKLVETSLCCNLDLLVKHGELIQLDASLPQRGIAYAVAVAVCDLAGVEMRNTATNSGDWISRFSPSGRVAELFANVCQPYLFLSSRLYRTAQEANNRWQATVLQTVKAAVVRALSVKDEFCEFFGVPGVFELVAGLTSTASQAKISDKIEKVRRTIPKAEPTLPKENVPGTTPEQKRRTIPQAEAPTFEELTGPAVDRLIERAKARLIELSEPMVAVVQETLKELAGLSDAGRSSEKNQALCRKINDLGSGRVCLLYKDQVVNIYYNERDGFNVRTPGAGGKTLYAGDTLPLMDAGLRVVPDKATVSG